MKKLLFLIVSVAGISVLAQSFYPQQPTFSYSSGGVTTGQVTNIVEALTADNVGVMDIVANSGISAPEYAWTNATPQRANQIGVARNSGVNALYVSTGTGKGQWFGNWMFNGKTEIGSQYWMSNAVAGDGEHAFLVWANGNPALWGTNGTAQGTEKAVVFRQLDPRQATYLNFNAPSGWTNGEPIIGADVDFQIGLGGYLYGTNTLNGIAINRDALITLNPPVDLMFTTTQNKGSYGCRVFLGYDNLNGVWHFPVDVSGNGSWGNTGYQDVITLDTKLKTLNSTNVTWNISSNFVAGSPGASVSLEGSNIQIGASGIGNTAKVSAGQLNLASSGTLAAPSILNRGNSRFQFINFDSSGDTQIGRANNQTELGDVDIKLKSDHSYVGVLRPLAVATNIQPLATLDVRGSILFQAKVYNHTANTTITVDKSGACIGNAGASGTVTNTLPTAVVGLTYKFTVVDGQNVTIRAQSGELIQMPGGASSSGGGYFSNSNGDMIEVTCYKTGFWHGTKEGTWTGF